MVFVPVGQGDHDHRRRYRHGGSGNDERDVEARHERQPGGAGQGSPA
jgi:hypothetical protein